MSSILVVDDEPIVLQSLADWLREDGHHVDTAEDADEAQRLASCRSYELAIIDIKMPGTDGLELQARLASQNPDLLVILMTAFASVESAVEALKAGAYDYLTKPFNPDELSLLVGRALGHRQLKSENLQLKRRLEDASAPSPIIGSSPAMRRVLDHIESVAATDSTVLVKGESGTGKELVARAIHAASARRYGPLVVVNCGALSEGILESELFGHEKGSFTGAHDRHRGKFERADGGTIFLDEIGAVSQRVQVDLLRVLEDKVVSRVGGTTPVPVDFRVVSATNQDLEKLVEKGRFRDDLYWRLNVFTIEIPPLRARLQDAELLARHFLQHYTQAMNRPPMRFSVGALAAICEYHWPGNVRELQNAVERAVVVGSPPVLELADLPGRVNRPRTRKSSLSLAEVERDHILSVLESTGWNITRAAKLLEIDRGTLYHRLQKYGMSRPDR